MKKFFNHILVPLNYGNRTTLAIEKAIQVANEFDCDLHLVYVRTPIMTIQFLFDGIYMPGSFFKSKESPEVKIKRLVKNYRPMLKDKLIMYTRVVEGNKVRSIKEYIITRHIDLVIIPHFRKGFVKALLHETFLNRLSIFTQCPILTVTPQFNISHLQNIVVPVNNFLPVRKLSLATFLARKFNAVIHIIGQGNRDDDKNFTNSLCLAKSYQLVHKFTKVIIHYPAETGASVGSDEPDLKNALDADLVVVNPGKEIKLVRWFSSLSNKFLGHKSNVTLLTVTPDINKTYFD